MGEIYSKETNSTFIFDLWSSKTREINHHLEQSLARHQVNLREEFARRLAHCFQLLRIHLRESVGDQTAVDDRVDDEVLLAANGFPLLITTLIRELTIVNYRNQIEQTLPYTFQIPYRLSIPYRCLGLRCD